MKKNKYKLDIIFPLLLVLLFSIFLVLERISYSFSFKNKTSNPDPSLSLIEENFEELYDNINYNYNERSLIIYDDDKDDISIKNNIEYVLESISVSVDSIDITKQEKANDLTKYSTIIVCIHDLESLNISFSTISNWVNRGGGLIFTNTLGNSDTLDEYKTLLGIKNETVNEVEVDSIMFLDNYLIYSKNRNYDQSVIFSSALDVKLLDSVTVHALTNDVKKIPLLWDNSYGNGHVSVSNSNILSGKQSRGLFMAMFSSVHDVYAYPVINSSMFQIDDFPSPILSGYDENIFKEYGYNNFDFLSNVWWPSIKDLALKYNIKYTSYAIQTYDDNITGPYDNTFFYDISKKYVKQLKSIGAEVGIHGYNHQPYAFEGFDYEDDSLNYKSWKSEKDVIESFDTALNYIKSLGVDDRITTYVAPSNILSKEGLEIIRNNFEDVKIFARVYLGNSATINQEFEANKDGTIDVPRIVSGMYIGGFEDFSYINELSYHFVVSNFIHPDDITDNDRSLGMKFQKLLQYYEKFISEVDSTNIRSTTVRQGAAAIQRYKLTTVSRTYDDNNMILDIDGLYDKTYFILKNNNKEIKNITGAKYKKICDNYYLLEVSNDKVIIEIQ